MHWPESKKFCIIDHVCRMKSNNVWYFNYFHVNSRRTPRDNRELFDRHAWIVCHDCIICFAFSFRFVESIIYPLDWGTFIRPFFISAFLMPKSIRSSSRVTGLRNLEEKKKAERDTWGVPKSNSYMIRWRKHHRFIINEITINRMASCRDDSETRTPAEIVLGVCICFHSHNVSVSTDQGDEKSLSGCSDNLVLLSFYPGVGQFGPLEHSTFGLN